MPQYYAGRLLTMREPYSAGVRATFFPDGQLRTVEGLGSKIEFKRGIDLAQGGEKARYRSPKWVEICYGKLLHTGTPCDIRNTRTAEFLPWLHGWITRMSKEFESSSRDLLDVPRELSFEDWYRPRASDYSERPGLKMLSHPNGYLAEVYYEDEGWVYGSKLWLHQTEPLARVRDGVSDKVKSVFEGFDTSEWSAWVKEQLNHHLRAPWTLVRMDRVPPEHVQARDGPRAEAFSSHPHLLKSYGYYVDGRLAGRLLELNKALPRGRLSRADGETKQLEETYSGGHSCGGFRHRLSWEKWISYCLRVVAEKPERPETKVPDPSPQSIRTQTSPLMTVIQAASFALASLFESRREKPNNSIYLPPVARKKAPISPKPRVKKPEKPPKRPAGRQIWLSTNPELELLWEEGKPAVGGFRLGAKPQMVTYKRRIWSRLSYREEITKLSSDSDVEALAFPRILCSLPLNAESRSENKGTKNSPGWRTLSLQQETWTLTEETDPYGWPLSADQRRDLILRGVGHDGVPAELPAGHCQFMMCQGQEVWVHWLGPLEGSSGYLGSFYLGEQLLSLRFQGDSYRDHLEGDRVSGYDTGNRTVIAYLHEKLLPESVREGKPHHHLIPIYSRALGGGIWERFHAELKLELEANTLVFDHVWSS